MTHKQRLYNKLVSFANNPENEFDKFIAQNKECIDRMTERQLAEIYTVRSNAAKLCRIIPFAREEIVSLLEKNEVSLYDKIAELENQFLIAEYIFTRVRGEKY